jgi:hypothetical protein
MMAIGGLLAMADRRYRAVRTRTREASHAAPPGLAPLVAQKVQP